MAKTHTTVEVAKLLGLHEITLYHWLKLGLVKPKQSYSIDRERKHYLWTDEEINAARKVKESRKAGRKPKAKK